MAFFNPKRQKTLAQLLDGLVPYCAYACRASEIVGDISYDSRSIQRYPGLDGLGLHVAPAPFINREDREQNPNQFIHEAIANGASVVIYDPKYGEVDNPNVLLIRSDNPRKILAQVSRRFYDIESNGTLFLGVTGTKGKTSICHMVHHLLNKTLGISGLVSTSGFRIGDERMSNFTPRINDTYLSCPESLELSGLIAESVSKGCKAFVIENTSHALALDRTTQIPYSGCAYSVIESDHLDFHGVWDNYFEAKKSLLDRLSPLSSYPLVAVIREGGRGDARLVEYARHLSLDKLISAGNKEQLMEGIDQLRLTAEGNVLDVSDQGRQYKMDIKGMPLFQVWNMVVSCALVRNYVKMDVGDLLDEMRSFSGIPGRWETVFDEDGTTVIVDFAHEPLSIRETISYARTCGNPIVTVFSATGDRDRTKRYEMGRLASSLSDYCILTLDSTHGERSEQIITDVLEGMTKDIGKYDVIPDRLQAIEEGFKHVKNRGMLLILGMGDENILYHNGGSTEWSDRSAAESVIARYRNK